MRVSLTKRTEPVVDGDDDGFGVAGEDGTVERTARAHVVAIAVHEEHDGKTL